MPELLARGDVVACGQAVGVVWSLEADELTVLPIGPGDGLRRRFDVPIDALPDQVAAGVAGRDLVIHADMPTVVPRKGQRKLGTLPGRLQCAVSQAVLRAEVQRGIAARWAGERERRMSRLAGLRSAV